MSEGTWNLLLTFFTSFVIESICIIVISLGTKLLRSYFTKRLKKYEEVLKVIGKKDVINEVKDKYLNEWR